MLLWHIGYFSLFSLWPWPWVTFADSGDLDCESSSSSASEASSSSILMLGITLSSASLSDPDSSPPGSPSPSAPFSPSSWPFSSSSSLWDSSSCKYYTFRISNIVYILQGDPFSKSIFFSRLQWKSNSILIIFLNSGQCKIIPGFWTRCHISRPAPKICPVFCPM